MNTLAFTFGIVCTIAVISVAVLVWAVVKVLKQEKKFNKHEDDLLAFADQVWKQRDEERRNQNQDRVELQNHLDRRFDGIYRDMDDRHRDVYTQINSQITDAVTQCKSYTDSRIDKMIEGNKPKQVIKG